MLIKTVSINGFKSYRELTTVDLSPGMNAIVGLNGSGKSNIIAAIQFALTEEYGKSSAQAKRDLLYNGIENAREPSYVEIRFDNRDRRLPVEADEVLFRRVFGLKKDVLRVNGKEVKEVKTFLQTAGFNNPYFILKQGQISTMALATDGERFNLLKQVAGVDTYEQNRRKTDKLIKELEVINQEVDRLFTSVNDRIEELRKQKKGIEMASTLDKEQRYVEYLIRTKEEEHIQRKIQKLMDKIENCKLKWAEIVVPKMKQLCQVEKDIIKANQDVQQKESLLARLDLHKTKADGEILDAIKKLEKLTGKLECLQSKEELSKSLNDPKNEEELQQKRLKLEQITKELTSFQEKEEQSRQLFIKRDIQRKLFEKVYGFTTKVNRDEWLKEEIQTASTVRKNYLDRYNAVESILKQGEQQLAESKKVYDDEKKGIKEIKEEIKNFHKQIQNEKQSLQKLHEEQSEYWKKENHHTELLHIKLEEEERMKENFQKVIGRLNFQGDSGIKQIIKDFENGSESEQEITRNYYGTVLENIVPEEQTHTAVEVTAGRRLMCHVVKDSSTGQVLMTEFNKRKLPGEVSFIPLDKIQPVSTKDIEPQDSKHVVHLFKYICSNRPEVVPALQFIFGKTLLCKENSIGNTLAKKYKMTCVTLDGQIFKSSGVITGGYINLDSSKIKLHSLWKKIKKSNEKRKQDVEELRKQQQVNEEQKTIVDRKIQKLKGKTARLIHLLENSQSDHMKAVIKFNSERLLALQTDFSVIKTNLLEVQEKIEFLQKQSKRPFKAPTDSDFKEIQKLKKEVKDFGSKLKDATKNRLEKEKEMSCLQHEIDIYEKSISQPLSNQLIFPELVEKKIQLLKEEIEHLKVEMDEHKRKQQQISEKYPALQLEIQNLKTKLSDYLDDKKRLHMEVSSGNPETAVFEQKLKLEEEKLLKYREKQTTATTLPSEVPKYKLLDLTELHRSLTSINKKLAKYKNISRVYLVEYDELIQKQDGLLEKMNKLKESNKKLQELYTHLEVEKLNKIINFFGLLQKSFSDIFKQLIPNGCGELILYGPDMELVDISQIEDDFAITDSDLTGVKLRVSFTSQTANDTQYIGNYSGGQKSLIALALILAIQKLDPVPVYLFDEVDHALDPDHRDAVASVIDEMSTNAQFICTTHRREFLEYAKSCFGVAFANNKSFVEKISTDDAIKFVPRSGENGSGIPGTPLSSLSQSVASQNTPTSNASTVEFRTPAKLRLKRKR